MSKGYNFNIPTKIKLMQMSITDESDINTIVELKKEDRLKVIQELTENELLRDAIKKKLETKEVKK